ncbi:PIG-L family deacetylase [Myceligenerans indicum]|uniref:PIG-L family deacetylase n=1 Tax=Actinomycetes TaxID=1760 RepID=UPI001FD3229C|nr:PIG-L family deacetylase [Myceligenerans indicum]
MAVHAHPDDETLSTGALLATWAAAGRPVTVVTCTRGERGEVLALPGTTSEGLGSLEGDALALAAHREAELARATAALGVEQLFLDGWRAPDDASTRAAGTDPGDPQSGAPIARAAAHHRGPVPRYEDSGMEWVAPGVAGPAADSPATAFARVPLDEPARRLAATIMQRRPAVVATYEAGGGYGHPDHVRAHDVTIRALELLADAGSAVPELWQAVAPAAEVRAARRSLAGSEAARRVVGEHGLTLPAPDGPLPPFAREQLPGRVERVHARPVLGPVLTAMRAHATQVQHVTSAPAPGILGFYALSNDVLAPVTEHETYLVSTS